ncbi:MAG TPA: substrate-binding domain-containing protein [Armatimonadota bacterium]|jgi:prepilin-type N-terminal cleavage/methylation domain-containing protein/prepilin-type processing-associated H-X9-DG protein
MRSNAQQRRGFTLIELLVVIGIIAILASILFPVFGKAMAKAKQTSCVSNLKNLSMGTIMYTQDKREYPGGTSWAGDLIDYVGNKKIYNCPADTMGASNRVSYAFNGCLLGADGKGANDGVVLNPVEVGMFIDGTSAAYPTCGNTLGIKTANAATDARHAGGFNVAYADGHVESFDNSIAISTVDPTNPIARAFYYPVAMGWVNNPGAGVMLPKDCGVTLPDPTAFSIAGSTSCDAFWKTAAAGWAAVQGGDININLTGSADHANGDVGGSSSLAPGTGFSVIASDPVGIIVSAATKLKFSCATTNDDALDVTMLKNIFAGTTDAKVTGTPVLYIRESGSGTRSYLNSIAAGVEAAYPTSANVCYSTSEMVNKVAKDPFGIGYASLGEIDTNKVKVLKASVSGTIATYNRANVVTLNTDGSVKTCTWPLTRPLWAKLETSNAGGTSFMSYVTNPSFWKSNMFKTQFFPPFGTGLSYTATWN